MAEPERASLGRYGDFVDEAREVAYDLAGLMEEDAEHRPIFSPSLVFNVARGDLDEDGESLLAKAHELAAKRGVPLFANQNPTWQRDTAYDTSGVRLAAGWRGDWELDTLRTGALGTVGVNLARVAYEAKGSESKLLKGLDECLSMAVEALRIKASAIEGTLSGGLLTFLSRPVAGETYLRYKNASCLIGLVGLNEAARTFTGKQLHEDKASMEFASEVVNHLSVEARRLSLKAGLRIALSHGAADEASQRFAELDVERHGWGVVNAQGTRDAPYYTDLTASPLEVDISLEDRLRLEGAFHPLLDGGHFLPIELDEPQQEGEALLKATKEIVQGEDIGAYAFTRTYGYCSNCKKTMGGYHQKCPECRSVEAYSTFSRPSASYSPLRRWPASKASTLEKRRRYHLI